MGDGFRKRPPVLAALAVAGIVTIGHFREVFLGETAVLRDALRFSLPSREYFARSLSAGRWPEWCDAVAFGAPFAANPVHGVTYPLTLLVAAIPGALGLDLFTLLHVLIAGLGAAALAWRFGAGLAGAVVAGGTLAMSGYVSSSLANGMAPLIAWTPWIAWAADRLAIASGPPVKEVALLAAFLALQVLPGEPTSILIAALLALFVVWARSPRPARATGFLAAAGLVALPLAAVALVPGLFVLAESARRVGLAGPVDKWSMYPGRVVEWAWPLAFGSERQDGFFAELVLARVPGDACWAENVFLGLPVLILAVVAAAERAARKWLLLSLVFVLFALGSHTPMLGIARKVFPPLRLCYYPEKWIYGATVAWSVLAGVGFTRSFASRPSRRLLRVGLAAVVGLGLAYVVFQLQAPSLGARLAVKARAWQVPVDTAGGLEAARLGGLIALLGAGGFAAALALSRAGRGRPRVLILAAAAILLPLVVTNWAATPLVARAVIEPVPQLLRALDRPEPGAGAPLPRVFRADQVRWPRPHVHGEEMARAIHETVETNVGSRFGVDMVSGMEPAESARVRRFWDFVFPGMDPGAFAMLMGVDAMIVQDPGQLADVWPTLATGPDGWFLLRPPGVRPRAFVTPRWFPADEKSALDELTVPARMRDVALVAIEHPDPALRPADGPLSPCRVERHAAEWTTLQCASATGGYAVLLEEMTRGWTATVDGRPAPILIADGLFRAVPVGSGAHTVEFRYRTPGLRLGAVISLGAWLACVALLVGWRVDRGRSTRPTATHC